MDVALATTAGLPETDQDEASLVRSLAGRGIAAELVRWDDPEFDWSAVAMTVIRSTWDYTGRRDEFVAWARRVERHCALWNPAEVVRWNTHKAYLMELEERGAPTVPTAWLGAGARIDLAALLADRGWDRAVLKPAVGASAEGLLIVEPHTVELAQHHLDALLGRGDVLVQPFLQGVTESGEMSLVLIDGAFSHAVRKRPRPGDVRTQIDFGASYEPVVPRSDLVDLATWVVEAVGHELLYARVDLIEDDDGTPQLSELEATEPSLYLAWVPEAADRLAAAIEDRL